MANRLSGETSPYLLGHAHNPVDWHPWGREALQRARSEDRPILLSVGYSACHWCHVMERESFEDPSVADLMNASFINVKVDREERPDVDQIYMKAVQAMTGSGGWPLTVFLTPMQEPYYGGTYFPTEARHGLPSFRQVLKAAAAAYADRPGDVRAASRRIVAVLEALPQPAAEGVAGGLDVSLLGSAGDALARQYDTVNGGFGQAPKFPQPMTLELLLREHLRTGEGRPLEMAVHTLRRMAAGGLRDHLGGGFHRYCVDAGWLVPHFEKMLYDNALLARAYTDAYRLTGADDLRQVAEQTLDYLLADLRDPAGGFYTARDADSEGEEGLFYLWTPDEVRAVLDAETARLFLRTYDVSEAGNFEGRNILHLPHPLSAVAAAEGMEAGVLEELLSGARSALLDARGRRAPALRDDKILTGWNGLALRALAEAGGALGRPDYLRKARETASYLLRDLVIDGRLHHTLRGRAPGVHGFLEDYASLGNALLSLHEATLEPEWLEQARWCSREILEHFWDASSGVLFDAPADAPGLIVRPRDAMDNATPSGNSLAAELLVRVGHIYPEEPFLGIADQALATEAQAARRYPAAFGRLLSVLDRRLAPPTEVALVGDPGDDRMAALLEAAWARPHRNLTVVGDGGPEARGDDPSPLLSGRRRLDGHPTAYVCRDHVCTAPVTTPGEVLREIASAPSE